MQRSTFVRLSIAAFALVLLSFVVMGFGRLAVPYRTARLFAAPTFALAVVLVAVLLVQSVLAVTGIRPLEEPDTE